ncbi:DUF1080 domain-containing protein [Aliifodinibius sp. 1BSP15-2V2]|uniref:DUF1080 domain-containing protein n=2 Tax=Fodinibius salsisoli TaxID=2820877 RepID=A0ABT3PKN5_9BACT|nr:DUF1080 domain-containing protein [Fodinibius salsisoli]
MKEVELTDLEAFQSVGDNWSMAGEVNSSRTAEHDLKGVDGVGTVVNNPTEEQQDHLFTQFEHGDLELELDFLMPKGSNSGIYLMGRYEVQLFDSWGVEEPAFSDVGGIYQRWDESKADGEKGFEGSAPRLNAGRAPGLWQHLKIIFKAPEFNEQGEKISNAEFKEVWLNGALIQENVTVSGPTRAAAFEDEQAEGPLMIQGDHGPVAVRNIKYKKYDKTSIALESLNYGYYEGAFDQLPDFDTLTVSKTGTADSLAGNIVEEAADRYALRYTATLVAPNSGTYLFKLRNAGTSKILIDGQPVIEQDSVHRMHQLSSATVELESGEHDFTLEYINHPNEWYRGLSLFAEGPRLRYQSLHASSSVQSGGRELPDLIVEPESHVKVIRSFKMHQGKKRTHVVNVGAPNGMNYSYDMGQAALLDVWEGPFLNANEMWIDRGEPQTVSSAGPPLILNGKPSIAKLTDGAVAWPDSVSWDQLQVEGYSIAENGWPVFEYSMDGVTIRDQIEGVDNSRRLVRKIEFTASDAKEGLWYQLASGGKIIQNDKGAYTIDDRAYYLNIINGAGAEPQIIQHEDTYDLRLPVLTEENEAVIEYEIIW